MSNTPANIRLALTALIHSQELSLRYVPAPNYNPASAPKDRFNALVSAHVSSAISRGNINNHVYKVTFKTIPECYGTSLRGSDEIRRRKRLLPIVPISVVLVGIKPADSWRDIYGELWEAEGVAQFWSKVLTSYHGLNDSERYSRGWTNLPDEYHGNNGNASPETELAAYFPETCPKAGLGIKLRREHLETIDRQEVLEYQPPSWQRGKR